MVSVFRVVSFHEDTYVLYCDDICSSTYIISNVCTQYYGYAFHLAPGRSLTSVHITELALQINVGNAWQMCASI